MNPDLDELLAAAREALSPEQVVYQRSRIRHALEVLVPRVVAELARRRAADGVCGPRTLAALTGAVLP